MLTIKLILLSVAMLILAVGAIAIKLFFQKDANLPSTSCKAIGPELKKRGVQACGTTSCHDEQSDDLPQIEFKSLEL